MQNIILALALLLFTTVAANAQCDKKVNWHAKQAQQLNDDGDVMDSKTGTILVETSEKNIRITIAEAPNQTLEGTIKETTCNWKEAYKNGTTTLKVELFRNSGESSNASFRVEGKDGKIIILMQIEQDPGKTWKILVDSYDEVK